MENNTNRKIKIAIILAGQLRNWDLCRSIFNLYNEIDKNIQYDFFLATWHDNNFNDSLDLSIFNSYEIISEQAIKNLRQDYRKYPFLLKRVNEIKNLYQIERDIKYDCVVSTRPDIFLGLDLLLNINKLILNTYSDQITPNTLYSFDGISEKINKQKDPDIPEYFFTMQDFFILGHQNAIDIHAGLYDDMYKNYSQKNYGVHITPAMHLINKKINVKKLEGFVKIIRSSHKNFFIDLLKTNELKKLYTYSKNFKLDTNFIKNFNKLS
tara:strand:- start:6775 stop:7575 length:801 start_codon:yes stop_codon:yes gene_type:complete